MILRAPTSPKQRSCERTSARRSQSIAVDRVKPLSRWTFEKSGLADFATGHPGRVAGTYEKPVAGLRYVIAYALGADEADLTTHRVIHTSRNWEEAASPD